MTDDLRTWWQEGERLQLEVPETSGVGFNTWGIFTRTLGRGEWVTLIHGFPTSSWDWAPIVEPLARRNRLLAFDMLGFGASDKPRRDFSVFEQAEIVETLWRHFGIRHSRIVAHDLGLTVALELLARRERDILPTEIDEVVLLNGGAIASAHRARRVQVLLQQPVIGALLAQLMSEGRFNAALREVFSPDGQPSDAELHQHWESVIRHDGTRHYHRLIKYIPQRRANAARWEGALERTDVPIRFVWGMVDPVSGAHMLDAIRARRPGADVVELPGVGHYPQLEAPDLVVKAILGAWKPSRRSPSSSPQR